ncbi:MAG TPA: GlxA family transcriptional regulator [Gammaproteobacteria bacterium]|nr:GlxA family transcriptional regulator [Gammaproteobacteria bacterium]
MGTEKVGILLIEGYPLIPFSCVLEALRTANRLSSSELYEWQFYAPNSEPVTSNSGITIPTIPLIDAGNLQTLVICAPSDADNFDDKTTLKLLKRFARQGVNLGTASFGSFILARAGLLDHCRSTIHWEHIQLFRELYPHLDVAFTLYEIAKKRFTCSGGTAALDMILKLIENQHGRVLAQEISQYFHHDRIRTDIDYQQMASRLDLAMSAPKLVDVINQMESNIELPVSLPSIAKRCNLSLRQMERLFHKYRSVTPSQYYLNLRLSHARQLLLNTNRSIIDISIATGFPSPSYFSACFRKYFGSSPRKHRSQVAIERRNQGLVQAK